MLTCEICGKADIKTGQGMAGHKQFAHKQLSSGEPARSSATLATEDLVFEQVTALESELQEEFQERPKLLERQLERRTLQLGLKAELSNVVERLEVLEVTMSELIQFVTNLAAVVLHSDEKVRGEKASKSLFRGGGLIVDGIEIGGVEWWKEEVYERKRDIVEQELRARS